MVMAHQDPARINPRVASLARKAVAITIMVGARPAWADDSACIKSYEQTQTLRRASHFREAHAEATKCARDTCPAVLSKDCTKWLSELEQSIPTIVFDVTSKSGDELTNVKVSMDGKPLVDKVDGKSLQMDVGPHVFRFEPLDAKDGLPQEQKVVVHEGDKNRKISITLVGKTTEPAAGAGSVQNERPIPTSVFVFGGLGVAAIGVGTAFALVGSGKEGDLDACRPNCPADDVNSASRSYAVADILWSAGAATAIAALYMFLSRPTVTKPNVQGAHGLSFTF